MIPVKVSARGNVPVDISLKKIGWQSACVVAAHQYLRALGREGYIGRDNMPKTYERNKFAALGQLVIEYFINGTNR
jgi:hypothetical protein